MKKVLFLSLVVCIGFLSGCAEKNMVATGISHYDYERSQNASEKAQQDLSQE